MRDATFPILFPSLSPFSYLLLSFSFLADRINGRAYATIFVVFFLLTYVLWLDGASFVEKVRRSK